MTDVLLQAENAIKKYNMIEMNDKIVVGVSGGPDSMCMLHILLQFKEKYNLSIYGAHLNHQFRGEEADKDARYVKDICRDWGIPFFLKVFDVPAYARESGLSAEDAGRIIRYRLYDEVVNNVGANKIAVAHNLNDHIETIFMNLIRGSGVEGLIGIEAVRDNIIRPLINTDRKDIEEYCDTNCIIPRIDKTNLEPIYGRNKVRLELIPYIEENLNVNIMNTLNRFSDIVFIENDFLDKESQKAFLDVAKHFDNNIKYSIIKLSNLHTALKRRVIRIGIEKLSGSLKNIEYKHIEDILSIIDNKTGSAVMLPKGIIAYVSYDNLIIKHNIKEETEKFCYNLEFDKDNFITSMGLSVLVETVDIKKIAHLKYMPNEVYIDKEGIKDRLVIRNRNAGDLFSPIGFKGSKKLKSYFIDEKVPREERDSIELIADGKEIVWVVGKRLSEKYKITENTKEAVRIRITRRTTNEE